MTFMNTTQNKPTSKLLVALLCAPETMIKPEPKGIPNP